jgi:hypothetical protein
MKRLVLLFAVSSATALTLLAAAPALGSGKPTRAPLPDASNTFDLAAGLACSFEVAAQPVINNEVTTTFPAQANGDVLVIITGRLVEQVTNVATGKSITVNISGPEKVVLHPDGSVTLTALGSSFLILFPTDVTPGPAFLINTGRYIATFSPSGQETVLSQSGTQFDVCAALS